LFLLPSERESFGLSALEAMACQVPVISSDAEGIPEVNIHGVTGYLSKVGDVEDMAKNSIQLLQNEELHKQMKVNALERAKSFDLHTIMAQFEAVYESVLTVKA
jgi:glycosyltransferase involved in cell wall biosynthesis